MKSIGRVSSLQTFATLDGPGVRFAVFLQGCPLRCVCCHNPETWDISAGEEYTAEALFEKAKRYSSYFGDKGGVTLSGGEPLMQAEFASEFFALCKNAGMNTCLDTSGCIINDKVKRLLSLTDYCLLDIKYATDEKYEKYVGCGIETPLEFLKLLDNNGITTRVRQVIIKGINDTPQDMRALAALTAKYKCVEETELLPFKKFCISKYEEKGVNFKLKDTPETTQEKINELKKYLCC